MSRAPRSRKTVLIVEDDAPSMKLFVDLLEARGYRTVCSQDGRDALALAEVHRPDLILMDIKLPGLSGIDLAKRIKADPGLSAIPVVALTAFAMKGDEGRFLREGCEGYLAKPISIARFLETVAFFVDDDGQRAAERA